MSSFTYNKEDLDTFALAYGVRIPPGFDESMITGEHSSKTLEKQLEIVKQKESILTQKLSEQKIIENEKNKEILEILVKLGNITDSDKLNIFNNLYEKILQYNYLINKFNKLDYNSNTAVLAQYLSLSRDKTKANYVFQEYNNAALTDRQFTYNSLKSDKILILEFKHFHTFIKKRLDSLLNEYKSIEMIENILEFLYIEVIKNS